MAELPTPAPPRPDASSHGLVRNYGSTPGELAACVRNVGLVRRAELGAIAAHGPAATVEAVSAHLVGHALAVGGSAHAGEAWWCRPGAETLLLVGRHGQLDRIAELLRTLGRRHPRPLTTGSEPLAAIGVVGHRAAALLRALGAYGPLGDPRTAPPCLALAVGEVPTTWLLESDVSAICFVAPGDVAAVERHVFEAGRPLGLARVGQDALAQYQLVERRRGSGAAPASA
jgi:hypothetical protein